FLGSVFGAVAGYYGKWLDDVFNWFYSVFTAIPYLLLILAVAAVLQQKGTLTIILILGLTGWTGVFRLIRGEYLKHKGREYVQAADAIGASNARRMFVHILPNVSHVVLVQLSILTVAFIKSEVILSFLGFGVPVDVVSWGSMLNEAQNELILGKWWQLAAAGTFMAVKGISFDIPTNATVALVGESGSGKSVTSLSILGLLPKENSTVLPGSEIVYGGQNLVALGQDELRKIRGADISMIFQEPMTSLNPVFTVGFQLTEVLRMHMGMGPAEARKRAIALLAEVGIPDPEFKINAYPSQMSGGQQQRVMIAMAIACEPKLLIADEPTTALDVTIQKQILELIAALQKKHQMS